MATILVANGYATNIGQNVREWETHIQQEDVPAAGIVSVCDLVAQAQPPRDASGNQRWTIWQMPVQFRIFLETGSDASTMRNAIKDVNRAIRQDDRWQVSGSGLAMTTVPEREGPLIPEDTFEMAGAVVEVTVVYQTGKFNSEE